jgi:hypothetical protein
LPTIAELARIVDLPLAHSEKIPISETRIQSLVNVETATDFCTREDVELLFRAEDSESLLDRFYFTVLDAPPAEGTENSFISFWDKNARNILEFLVPGGRSTRNSNLHTATMLLRPDYAFLIGNLCPFRGEEKAPESKGDPKKELGAKLVWSYDPAPYVLGELMMAALFNNIIKSIHRHHRLLRHGKSIQLGGHQPSATDARSSGCP